MYDRNINLKRTVMQLTLPFWQRGGCLLLLIAFFHYGNCQLQCNAATRLKRFVIKNPAQQQLATSRNMCRYTVQAASTFVCQVRIDFDRFELAQPTLNATTMQFRCVDYLQVNNFKICGRNVGQHLYVPLRRNALILDINLQSTQWTQAMWQLTLTQLDCPVSGGGGVFGALPFFGRMRTFFGSHSGRPSMPLVSGPILPVLMPNIGDFEQLAPLGCDQFYRASEGRIQSFNYNENGGGVYLPDMTYVICIKSERNNDIEYTFKRFAMANNAQLGFDSDCHATINTPGRFEHYLLIPQSSYVNNVAIQPTYYCGTSLNGVTIKGRPPFIMHFAADDRSSNAAAGFDLSYKVLQSSISDA